MLFTRSEFVKWMLVQWVSIFCVCAAAMLFLVWLTRIGETGFITGVFGFAYIVQIATFYALHWKLQSWAYDLDPLRSDRVTAILKMQPSKLDKDW